MPPITVYSTTWCGYCRTLKMFLTQNAVPFDEVDIEEQPQYGPLIEQVTGGYRTVPTVKIGEEYYVNPSGRDLRRILGLGQQPAPAQPS